MPLRRSFLLHDSEQFRVEIHGCVLAQPLQFFIHRRDLDQTRHVPAGSYRNSYVRHFKSENFVKLAVETDPINLINLLPVLQGNNKIETLFDSDTANPENLRYIDNSDAAGSANQNANAKDVHHAAEFSHCR